MQDYEAADCPMSEPFRAKIGITVFLACLFYQEFITRIIFAPLMPAIETDMGLSHVQAGGFFLMISIGLLLAPLCSGLISSKINHRGTLNVSAWGIGLILIPFAFVDSIWAIRGLLVTTGFAAGLHLPSAIATITAEVRKDDWGKALSVHQSAPPLSFVTAGILAMLPLFLVNEHGFNLTKANTLIGFSQVAGLLMVFVAGWITDRVGQKPTMTVVLLAAGVATILIGLLDGGRLMVVIFVQPVLVNAFFPGAFAALSRIAPPHLRSVANALIPPSAFLIGGGILPALIGYMGEIYTFAAGITLAGAFMLMGPVLVYFLKLGQYDDQAGC